MDMPNKKFDADKKKAFEERMAKRQRNREEKYAKMKGAENNEEAAPEEDKEKVRQAFDQLTKSALQQIEAIASEDDMKKAYEKVVAAKDYISLHTYHLQSYELQAYMESIRQTESKYNEKKDKLPKKKFQFKNLVKTTHAEVKEEKSSEEDLKINLSEDDISITEIVKSKRDEKKGGKDNCYCYIGENKEAEIAVDAEISIKQLYCNKNEDCVLRIGKVLGSALIYNCKGCKFRVSAHQVRIHNCTKCEFELFSNSGPVIEHSKDLAFKEISEENIPEVYKGKPNHCAEVMDFNWQKKEKSPNWMFVPK
eukprot:TRINITY_DN1882_c0_g2_i15.p1 TRINITY_DN1882_c0_g2~~TRINITY_DN1882_c0_g2_i15.p1  ORF type:complete len:309 (-),score=99.60 TRINITY_DN1882_c0_g2_i15:122-1048(-)